MKAIGHCGKLSGLAHETGSNGGLGIPAVCAPSQSTYKKEGLQEEQQIHKIRITLTSRNVKSLEKGEAASSCCCSVHERKRAHQIVF